MILDPVYSKRPLLLFLCKIENQIKLELSKAYQNIAVFL